MEKINERFCQIRKDLSISQAEMGNAIGISASGVSNIEKGIRSVTKKHVRLLSVAFNVNENWLEHGVGTMFKDNDGTIVAQLSREYNLNASQTALIRSFLSLSNEQREAVASAICTVAQEIENARKEEAQKEQEKRGEAHRLLDMELDAEEKGLSVSTSGSSGMGAEEEA